MATGSYPGPRVVDISDPNNPIFAVPGYPVPSFTGFDIVVEGDYAYQASWGNGLQIFDILNPSTPIYMGGAPIPSFPSYGVEVDGNYAYVAAGGKMQIVDIINPFAPTITGMGYAICSNAYDIDVQGIYAYVADGPALRIVDISNPTPPGLVLPSITYPVPGNAWDVVVSGDYAYIAAHSGGIHIVNISDPLNPRVEGPTNTGAGGWSMGAYEKDYN
jgi:hypothetical protein